MIRDIMKVMRKLREKDRTALLLPASIIAVVAFAVYFSALFNDFVYDDTAQVLENPWIRDVRHVPDMFLKSVWSFRPGQTINNYYRPLMHVFYMLTYHAFGLKPWGFHLLNILFHTANSVLVFFISARLLGEIARPSQGPTSHVSRLTLYDSRFVAFIAALLFATHPVHSEAVTWIAGLPEVSFSFFFLLSFLLYVSSNSDRPLRKGFYPLSVVCFALSAFCKEPALTLPAVLVLYDFVFPKEGDRRVVRFMRYVPYLVVAAAYFALRIHALEGFAPEKQFGYLSTYQCIINIFPLFTQYIGKLLFPINLNGFYVFHPITDILGTRGVFSLFVTTCFIFISFALFRKQKSAFLALLLFVLPLLPVFYIRALGENVFTERYLYLPSFGFVLLCSLAFSKVGQQRKMSAVIASLLVVVIGLYSAGTIARNAIWKNDYTFIMDTLRKSPEAVLLRNNLGMYLAKEGRTDEAIEQLEMVVSQRAGIIEAYTNLGAAYGQKGLLDKSIEQLEIAVSLSPGSPDAQGNLAQAYRLAGFPDKAIEHYKLLLQIVPDSANAHNDLGMTYMGKGLLDKAIEEYQAAIRFKPDYAEPHYNLGLVYAKKGNTREAVAEYEKVVAIAPDFVAARYNLGNAYADAGRLEEAIEQYRTVVRLQPDNAFYRNVLGIKYGQKGSYDEAISQFEAAVRLAPGEPAFRRNLERAQELLKRRRARG